MVRRPPRRHLNRLPFSRASPNANRKGIRHAARRAFTRRLAVPDPTGPDRPQLDTAAIRERAEALRYQSRQVIEIARLVCQEAEETLTRILLARQRATLRPANANRLGIPAGRSRQGTRRQCGP